MSDYTWKIYTIQPVKQHKPTQHDYIASDVN